jgi:hypothetical protein
MGVGIGGKETLIPTVSPDGRVLSDNDAIALYRRSGQHLGKFDSVANANSYAQKLHEDQAAEYSRPPGWLADYMETQKPEGLAIVRREEGGPVSKGQPAVVGEKGPELVLPTSAPDAQSQFAHGAHNETMGRRLLARGLETVALSSPVSPALGMLGALTTHAGAQLLSGGRQEQAGATKALAPRPTPVYVPQPPVTQGELQAEAEVKARRAADDQATQQATAEQTRASAAPSLHSLHERLAALEALIRGKK